MAKKICNYPSLKGNNSYKKYVILQGSNIYKLWENDSEIIFLSIALVWRGYHFTCHKGNNSYKKNVKNVAKLVRFKQKGQKQASFLAFHKCCQGCLLRGPRYISTSFILVFCTRCKTGMKSSPKARYFSCF
jgi:hypothetical protein